MAVPAGGADRAPGPKVEDRRVPVDLERQHRQAEEVAHDIVPGKAAHRPAVLARHHARSGAVDQKPRCVAPRKLGCKALDLQKGVDRQPAKPVAFHRKAAGQGVGVHAGAPDDGLGGNALAGRQGGARLVDRCDEDAGPRLDAEHGSASSMTVRASSPISEPIHRCRSARMTRGRARAPAPNAVRNLTGVSAAASTPVSPPPITRTVSWSGDGGRLGSAAMCALRRLAAS